MYSVISSNDLRARLAHHGVYGYRIAARIRINPIKLSRILNGHVPLTDDLAVRILRAIEEEAHEVQVARDGGPDAA